MKSKVVLKILSLFLCTIMFASVSYLPINVEAATLSELQEQQREAQQNLNNLKKKKADQEKIKKALDKQIASTQAIIDAYNDKIYSYSYQINKKQKEIDSMNQKISGDKAKFKKRIRSIYMSNTQSGVQILLGAENFSDYLVLAQMAKSVTKHDKALVEKISKAVSIIKEDQDEISQMLNEQKAAKNEVAVQKAELDKQIAEVRKNINSIQRDINKDMAELKKISDEIDSQSAPDVGGGGISSSDGLFLWPSANFHYISAGFDSDDNVHHGNHKGIDIAGHGISGTPVRAAASGTVYLSYGNCRHNYGKNYSCGCGGGYGNYVAIDHGIYKGNHYKTLYAHMARITVHNGQHVSRGQVIGYVGTTGWSTGPHIHFETNLNNKKVNPMRFKFQW